MFHKVRFKGRNDYFVVEYFQLTRHGPLYRNISTGKYYYGDELEFIHDDRSKEVVKKETNTKKIIKEKEITLYDFIKFINNITECLKLLENEPYRTRISQIAINLKTIN